MSFPRPNTSCDNVNGSVTFGSWQYTFSGTMHHPFGSQTDAPIASGNYQAFADTNLAFGCFEIYEQNLVVAGSNACD